MDILERTIQKTQKNVKGDKNLSSELELLKKVESVLNQGKSARTMDLSEEEAQIIRELNLLSFKPIIYAANVAEDQIGDGYDNPFIKQVEDFAASEGSEVVVISAKVEAEIAELEEDEKQLFLEEMGIEQSGLEKLIKVSYKLLDLISFLTAGEPEVRAWTIKRGSKASQAAGKIHTDFEKGFIRAETIAYG